MRHLMLYDTLSCLNCFACMSACSAENRMRMARDEGIHIERSSNALLPETFYFTPVRREVGAYPKARVLVAFHHCRHCEHAPCLANCPSGAIERRPGGQVVINASACIGCRTCIDVCPYDVPRYDPVSNTAKKCIGCYDRVESGRQQVCVSACPAGALVSGSEAEVIAEGEKRLGRYAERLGGEYMLYGKEAVNATVGRTGWLTLAPKALAEAYLLPENPVKRTMQARQGSKTLGTMGLAGIGAGAALHSLHWLSARKKKVREEEHGE